MPKRLTVLSAIALGCCVSLFASGAYAQTAAAVTAPPPAAQPMVIVVVEQPPVAPADRLDTPPEDRRPPRGKEQEEWYGYQTLIVDGASLGLMVGGATMAARNGGGDSGGTVALAGGIGYVLGAPIVHWMHGRIGPGFGSLGLRLGVPLAGMFWGGVIGAASGGDEAVGAGAAIGFLGGMAGAILLDAALLAYDKPSEKEKEAYETAKAKHPIRWVPTLAPVKSGGTVGVSGLFF